MARTKSIYLGSKYSSLGHSDTRRYFSPIYKFFIAWASISSHFANILSAILWFRVGLLFADNCRYCQAAQDKVGSVGNCLKVAIGAQYAS